METIGERLLYTRTQILSMSQTEFSRMLKISQGALSEIENNKRGIPLEAIIELLKYSNQDNNISCKWILTGLKDEINHTELTVDEKELITTYNLLDRRGQHRIHTIIYEELDRIESKADLKANPKYDTSDPQNSRNIIA